MAEGQSLHPCLLDLEGAMCCPVESEQPECEESDPKYEVGRYIRKGTDGFGVLSAILYRTIRKQRNFRRLSVILLQLNEHFIPSLAERDVLAVHQQDVPFVQVG